jgi:hypothetical protein
LKLEILNWVLMDKSAIKILAVANNFSSPLKDERNIHTLTELREYSTGCGI